MKLEERVKDKIRIGICAFLILLNAANGVQLYADNKPKVVYNFREKGFFQFEPKKKLEELGELIDYTIEKYSPLIQTMKKIYPDYSFEELAEDSSLGDKWGFIWLTKWDYTRALKGIHYPLVGDKVDINGDYLEFSVADKNKKDYLKIRINILANPESVKISDINNFLNSDKDSLVVRDRQGNFVYSITRYDKK
jgi:hypothetical protein